MKVQEEKTAEDKAELSLQRRNSSWSRCLAWEFDDEGPPTLWCACGFLMGLLTAIAGLCALLVLTHLAFKDVNSGHPGTRGGSNETIATSAILVTKNATHHITGN